MQVTPLSTGSVQIKQAMATGRGPGPVRLLRTLLDRRYTDELPIHAWVVHHPGGPILIDAGELASTGDSPVGRFRIEADHEIDRQLAQIGIAPQDLRFVVLTHLHPDHVNGLARLPGVEVVVAREALTRGGRRRLRRLGVDEPRMLEMTDERCGAFERSARLTEDGLLRAVPVPGHARGQVAVVVERGDDQVVLAADAALSQRQLLAGHPDGVSVSARTAVRSLQTMLEHARSRPTVFLPSHDPASARRLATGSHVPAA